MSRNPFPGVARRWWLMLLIAGALVLSGYVIFGKEGGVIRVIELRRERDRLQLEVDRLKAEKVRLESQIEQLERQEPMVIEGEARRKGLVREGEQVYRLRYQAVPDSTKREAPGKPGDR
ncbi:MAG TPA: septum formation initiator family protein [Bacteroidetes bacterium]|nr:septum formation initiator family protein [Bacteroidota bacterium]